MNYRTLIVLKNAYACFFLVQFNLCAYKMTSYETNTHTEERKSPALGPDNLP